ncbi:MULTISPECIES: tRNA1(Val) (adenine(37)-N6)-methyltransferase [unclassified Ruegeria]|uniref:tRNA1(Val) (adenine(37)-N6)-methyltransferase n=1 Tax=unclassified Ruegeria TaxID=2625375 RepID=UPI001492012F|nr:MULTISPECIES: methyltransferase domain-containing protein [unclassified Ruegeria]NOD47982.1 methyltransferase [Ruegeria sp. HKCCD5849]NOD52966.1 methyltransferase [Ruegeria sp. HKCCD5851]NOD69112.1 methyltransferase [Ruegeria sp. HKCCD7303]
MTRFDDNDLTCNDFLGGRIRLLQPASGYRAGIDPVLLAASVPASADQSVLELGCGAGAAILCLSARVPDLHLTGIELQPAYADLARRNAEMNSVKLDLVEADLTALPVEVRQCQFDHVIANPPYYRAGAHSRASDAGRSIALGEDTPLSDWISVAAKRLAPQGYLHMIQKADRLPDMIVACADKLGSVEVLPLCARAGRQAELVILRARKGGRAAFRLHAPLILHAGERHEMDGESYTDQIVAVLRHAAPLPRF